MGTGQVGRVRSLVATLGSALAVFLPCVSAAAERELTAVDDVKAFVETHPNWCRSPVNVIVRSPSARPFRGLQADRIELDEVIAHIGRVLTNECPAATSLRFITATGDTRWWEGSASAENNWAVSRSPIPIPTEPVAACDALAAHRDDPRKTGTGMADEYINTARAIAACDQAVKAEPKSARLWFQLGRAYWAAERFEEAIEKFVESAQMGHGGALAYLGDATLYGVGGLEPDPETAKGLYEQAAKAGFKPAAELAAEIVAGVAATAQAKPASPEPAATSKSALEPKYEYPYLIKALMAGKAAWTHETRIGELPVRMERPLTILYVTSVLNGVAEHCPDLVPQDLDDKYVLAVERALKELPWRDQMTIQMGAETGKYNGIKQGGLDDGYAVAYSKGCHAKETQTVVATGLRHL
jgi:tetratricopeptide (TPR) repeat protein